MAVNELDKQIARMKGLNLTGPAHEAIGAGWEIGLPPGRSESWGAWWSESESLALDLADELTEAGLEVKIASWWTPETGRRHRVTVSGLPDTPEAFRFQVEAGTRPEAICKAWIASHEWMTGKG